MPLLGCPKLLGSILGLLALGSRLGLGLGVEIKVILEGVLKVVHHGAPSAAAVDTASSKPARHDGHTRPPDNTHKTPPASVRGNHGTRLCRRHSKGSTLGGCGWGGCGWRSGHGTWQLVMAPSSCPPPAAWRCAAPGSRGHYHGAAEQGGVGLRHRGHEAHPRVVCCGGRGEDSTAAWDSLHLAHHCNQSSGASGPTQRRPCCVRE